MSLLRNLLTVIGVIAVFGVFYLFVKPDWYEKLASSPAKQDGPNVVLTGTVRIAFNAKTGTMEKDPSDNSSIQLVDILEGSGQSFPSRNVPSLLLVDKNDNQMRYWKLAKGVKKVTLRNPPSLATQFKESPPTNYSPNYMVEVWMNQPTDLSFEVELGQTSK